jgi:hypothetical protein
VRDEVNPTWIVTFEDGTSRWIEALTAERARDIVVKSDERVIVRIRRNGES